MATISIVYAVQSYTTFQINSDQLIESSALKNQVLADRLIQKLDLFVDRRINDFKSLEKAKEIRDILKSSNTEFSQISDIDQYMYEKTFSYENYNRYLPFLTQAVEQKHQRELSSIITNYDQTYGFDFAEEFFITNAYGANIVLIVGLSDYVQYDKEWWQITREEGIYVGDVEYFPTYGSYSIPLGISISDEKNEFIGAIRVLIGLEHLLSDFINNADILKDENKQVMLLDGQGKIIYDEGIIFGQNKTVSFAEELTNNEDNFEFQENGLTQIISYAKSKDIDYSLQWTAVVKQDKTTIISSLENIRNSILLPAVIGAIITIAIGIVITIFVSKPIEKLTQLYTHISTGKFDLQSKPSRIREINILSSTYNNLTNSLKRLIETEKDLAEAKVKVRNERLAAIGELSASMAHDMKNPLAIIKTTADILKRKFKGQDEKIDMLFHNMDDGISRISHQIKDVLEYVRITPMNLTDVSLKEMIYAAIKTLKIPDNISIIYPKGDLQIKCDRQKMEIVLINLILNAIQAIDKQTGTIEFSTRNEPDNYIIEIQNTGMPIPDKILPKIFEPLFTTKHQGTGLGLATCKNVIEQHGGTISAKNNPTRFIITFPKNTLVN